jgi:hypothetical protein
MRFFFSLVLLIGYVDGLRAFPVPKVAPYVELDFTTATEDGAGDMRMTIQVLTTHKNVTFSEERSGPRKFPRETTCACTASGLKEVGFKVEIIDKLKLRVYGCTREGVFYPVTTGKVESPDLKPEELPKVKYWPRRDA